MNIAVIIYVLGSVLLIESALMVLPIIVALLMGMNDWIYFIYAIIPLVIVGFAARFRKPENMKMRYREGLAAVALAWILLAGFGALPFYFSGYFASYIDCFFETVSGFTTTGATILREIEGMGNGGLMFWRSFTHWIGGMGILVFVLALIPSMDGSNVQLLKAESPGPTPGKVVPKLKQTAQILYIIYFGLTVAHIIALLLTKMPLYDSVIHSMGSAGTGGFSNMNASVGAYGNAAAEWVIAVFMLLFGVNFSLYYMALRGGIRDVFKNEEFRTYVGIVAGAVVCITLNIAVKIYDGNWGDAIRAAFFQVASIVTTTGYSTADFNLWPSLSKMIIVTLMIIGASAGSTGGGIKVSRLVVLFKAIREEFRRLIHPRMVRSPRMDGKVIENSTVRGILIFFATYAIVGGISMLIISIDGFDMETTITSVLSALGNIGPGLSTVGPVGNFADFSALSKLVLSFDMLAGRLELFPMLILFVPSTWKRS